MYGLGMKSLAEQIEVSEQEAQSIIDTFYQQFPRSKDWMDTTVSNAITKGYVEDFWGRRRRLPDIQLPTYVIKSKEKTEDNPILTCKNLVQDENSLLVESYKQKLNNTKNYKEISYIKSCAKKDNILITDNGSFISKAKRQCVNARIQGGAASMSKCAMIDIYNDKILKDLGFKLQLVIHDEVVGECDKENAVKASERLCEIMKNCARDRVVCPMKCDPTIEDYWYETEYKSVLEEEFVILQKTHDIETSKKIMKDNHQELTEQECDSILASFCK